MKKLKVLLITTLAVMSTFSFVMIVYATLANQDGLYVDVTTNKDNYSVNEDIEVTIKLENRNNYAVENISIEGIIPEGLNLKSGQDNKQVESLEANESIELSFTAIKDEETERQTEIETDEGTEKETDEQTERQTEKVTEKQTEQQTEKTTEKQTERQTEKVTEKQTEQQTEKITEKQTERQTEKVIVDKRIKVKSIKLNKKKITLKRKQSIKLKATIKPKNATNKKIKWTSSNKKVVKVNSKGKITALRKGRAKIYAKAKDGSGKKAVCIVTVKNVVKKKK